MASADPPHPFQKVADGVTVALRVAPKASRTAVTGVAADADDTLALKVAVTAPPSDGKANEAVVALLAKEWRLAKSRLTVVSGLTDRRKRLHIAGDPVELLDSLTTWLAAKR